MDITELHSLLSVGEQTRKVEIKRSISWDVLDHRAKIVKTILGLSNIRDGGYLVIGVEQRGDEFVFQGIEEDHLSSYNYDNVATECSRARGYLVRSFPILNASAICDPKS